MQERIDDMKTELRFEEKEMPVASLGGEACVPDLSGEMILQNRLRFQLGEEDEIYEGYGQVKNAYPYSQRNSYTRELRAGKVKTAVLENRYLKAVFLTEYGGRLWELWDKEYGENLLYTNDVLRFSNLAVRNAWFSGGVEWNLGIIGHTPFTTEKMYVARTSDEKGNPVLRMYEYERIRNVTYQMDFWLEEESRFLNCRMRIVNENTEVVPMYWWSNMAVPEYEGGRLLVPADEAYTCVSRQVSKVEIPVVNGVDVTSYEEIPLSVDYFFALQKGAPRYIANVNKDGYGLVQMSTDRLQGRKLFSWGHSESSAHWQEFLTEKAGPYAEIQAGLGKTQYGCIPMAPNTAWEWLEQYGAVDIGADRELSFGERSRRLTERLQQEQMSAQLEEKLRQSKPMALSEAKLVQAGSGYGVLGVHGKWTSHLEFLDEEGSYKDWKHFLEGGRLPVPDPQARPGVFLNDKESRKRLEEGVKAEEKENWYAHYHLGLRYYQEGAYEKAGEEFKISYTLAGNAWALHGLACTELQTGSREKAAEYMSAGIQLQKQESSYVKEGFKLLLFCGCCQEICRFYEQLDAELQEESRIKFYYIRALSCVGREKEAYGLLEAKEGFVLDDIREGEDSLAAVWQELHEKLYGEKGQVPHRYCFDAFA